MPSRVSSALFAGDRRYCWVLAVLVLVLDQLTKHLAFAGAARQGIDLIPGVLRLITRTNPQGALSLGPSAPGFYIAATLGGLALIAWMFLSSPAHRLRPYIALGVVAGGALGNLVDRLAYRAVRDFLVLPFMDWAHWPGAFNVADVGICVGVGLLLLEAFRPAPPKGPPPKPARQRPLP